MEESWKSHRKDLTDLGIVIKLVMINKPLHSPYLNASKTRQVSAWKSRGEINEKTLRVCAKPSILSRFLTL